MKLVRRLGAAGTPFAALGLVPGTDQPPQKPTRRPPPRRRRQTAIKPLAKPATGRQVGRLATPAAAMPASEPIRPVRRPVFVPPPPVIELDEMAAAADLPTVLSTDERDRYRRIFQAQASRPMGAGRRRNRQGQRQDADGLCRSPSACSSPGYQARYEQLAAWLQDYNDHPDAPAIYRLALARRRRARATSRRRASSAARRASPTFAAARTVTGADAGPAAELRTRLQRDGR